MSINFNAMSHHRMTQLANEGVCVDVTGNGLRDIGFRRTDGGCYIWECGWYAIRWMCHGDESRRDDWELSQPGCESVRMSGILAPKDIRDIWILIQKMKERGL